MEVWNYITKLRLGNSQRGTNFNDKLIVPGPGSYTTQGKMGNGSKVI